jgi:hypothetical protein
MDAGDTLTVTVNKSSYVGRHITVIAWIIPLEQDTNVTDRGGTYSPEDGYGGGASN